MFLSFLTHSAVALRNHIPSKHIKVGHYRPTSVTPTEWRFAGGPILTSDRVCWHGKMDTNYFSFYKRVSACAFFILMREFPNVFQ